MSRAITVAGTDRERMQAVFAGLAARGVAYWFDLRGSKGSISERWDDYVAAAEKAGTDLWVGEHVGSVETGGGYWGDDGRLYGGRKPNGEPYGTLWFSWNHEHPELAELLVSLFTAAGFDASWGGDESDSVHVRLADARCPMTTVRENVR